MTNKHETTALPRTIWILGLASLFTDISSEMIHSVLPLFLVASLHSSAAMVGLIDGFGEAVASTIKLFSGVLSDYFKSRKPLVLAGYGLSAFVKPLFALAYNPMIVLMARGLDRTGKGIRTAPRDALVADVTVPSNRGAAYGLRQSMDSVGASIGPAVAFLVLLSFHNHYRLVFWLAVIPGIITVLLLAIGVKEPLKHTHEDQKKRIDWQVIKNLGRNFWMLFVVIMIFTLGNSSDAFILLRSQQLGLSTHLVPLVLLVMNVVYALTAYPIGKLSDRMDKKNIVLSSFGLYALVYAGFALCTSVWQIWIFLVLYGLYLGLSQGTILALTADYIPAHLRGTAFGFLNLSMGIALLPASLLGGWFWDAISPQATFLAGSIFAILALLIFWLEPSPKK